MQGHKGCKGARGVKGARAQGCKGCEGARAGARGARGGEGARGASHLMKLSLPNICHILLNDNVVLELTALIIKRLPDVHLFATYQITALHPLHWGDLSVVALLRSLLVGKIGCSFFPSEGATDLNNHTLHDGSVYMSRDISCCKYSMIMLNGEELLENLSNTN